MRHFKLANILRTQGQLSERASIVVCVFILLSGMSLGISGPETSHVGDDRGLPEFKKGNARLSKAAMLGADDILKSADELFARGDFEEARQKYEEALESTPDASKIIERLGFIHFFQGQYQKGIECFQKVIGLDPSRREQMLHYLAFSYYLMQDYAGVVSILEEVGPVNLINTEQMRHLAKSMPYWIESKTDETVIPFIQLDPLPIIEIKVNSKNLCVLIDTGGVQLIIDSDFAKENNIAPLSQGDVNGFAGGKKGAVSYGTVESVSLSDITIKNVPIWILPTRAFSSDAGRRIDGILGSEILMQFLPTLDFPNRKLILRLRNGKHAAALRAKQTKVRIPFIIDNIHSMYAQCFVNKRGPVLMYFDSGLSDKRNAAFVLTGAALEDLQLTKPEMTEEGVGGGGSLRFGYVEIDRVSVSDLVQNKLKAIYAGVEGSLLTPAGYKTYGVISHNFLKHYAWTINFEDRWFLFDY